MYMAVTEQTEDYTGSLRLKPPPLLSKSAAAEGAHPLVVFNCYHSAPGTQRAVLELNMRAQRINSSMLPSGTPKVIYNQTTNLAMFVCLFFFFLSIFYVT